MSDNDLKQKGYFEKAPDVDGQFRVVTTHEYPMGWLMAKIRVAPLTEKWEQGTLNQLERVSKSLSSATPGPIMHPAFIRHEEDIAEWKRDQGRVLSDAITEIRAELDKQAAAEDFPVSELGDPVM